MIGGLSVAIWLVVLVCLPRTRWTGCKCGRERPPWFYVSHEKEWVMGVLVVLFALGSVLAALNGYTFVTVVDGLVTVMQYRALHEHRKGKRSILGRLLGRVFVTEHGRLAIGGRP